jgi:Fic-DOC domain mobile mystery protein B
MDDKTKIADATYIDDISGLKLPKTKAYTMDEIYFYEAKNITKATIKYLSIKPTKKLAPFSFEWLLKLHKDMFGDVWEWAGKIRQVNLSIGIKPYLISTELKKLIDDIEFWEENKSFEVIEIASRIHHRAVFIHPFLNGNGRWARMLANIYLKQNGLEPTSWNENLLSKTNPTRKEYIKALKLADNGDFSELIKLQGKTLKK